MLLFCFPVLRYYVVNKDEYIPLSQGKILRAVKKSQHSFLLRNETIQEAHNLLQNDDMI